jgi:hypothetical protein
VITRHISTNEELIGLEDTITAKRPRVSVAEAASCAAQQKAAESSQIAHGVCLWGVRRETLWRLQSSQRHTHACRAAHYTSRRATEPAFCLFAARLLPKSRTFDSRPMRLPN